MLFCRSIYTIEALSWTTGRSLYHVELSPYLLVNSLYAATEVGANRDIVMGSLGGILRVADAASVSASLRLSELKAEELPPVWQVLDELAQVAEKGGLPNEALLAKLGLDKK